MDSSRLCLPGPCCISTAACFSHVFSMLTRIPLFDPCILSDDGGTSLVMQEEKEQCPGSRPETLSDPSAESNRIATINHPFYTQPFTLQDLPCSMLACSMADRRTPGRTLAYPVTSSTKRAESAIHIVVLRALLRSPGLFFSCNLVPGPIEWQRCFQSILRRLLLPPGSRCSALSWRTHNLNRTSILKRILRIKGLVPKAGGHLRHDS